MGKAAARSRYAPMHVSRNQKIARRLHEVAERFRKNPIVSIAPSSVAPVTNDH